MRLVALREKGPELASTKVRVTLVEAETKVSFAVPVEGVLVLKGVVGNEYTMDIGVLVAELEAGEERMGVGVVPQNVQLKPEAVLMVGLPLVVR